MAMKGGLPGKLEPCFEKDNQQNKSNVEICGSPQLGVFFSNWYRTPRFHTGLPMKMTNKIWINYTILPT